MTGARFTPPPGFFATQPGPLRARSLPVRAVSRGDAEYPQLLHEIPEPPQRVWVAGRDLREMQPGVAVVGARRANGYGIRVAADLAADLAGSGACIVSGLARGVDAAAHDGALSVGGATLGVLGCGVDVCYPPRSRVLYAEIAARGSLVSVVPPGTAVQKSHLVRRNEILIGLSIAVVVVQGHGASAAVRTGQKAMEWGRTVLAVPGPIDWSLSEGVHGLLDAGALVCTGPGSVAHQLGEHIRYRAPAERSVPRHLTGPQRRVLEVLSAGAASLERIVALSGLDPSAGSRAVMTLELDGFIAPAGSLFRRIR